MSHRRQPGDGGHGRPLILDRAGRDRPASPARATHGELRLPVAVLLAIAAILGGCTTPSRRVAVTTDGGAILLYAAGLTHVDTVRLSDGFLEREPVGAWLAPDGTTLYAARRTATAGALVRARLADGVILDRIDFFDGSPAIVQPLYDGRTVLAATVSRSAGGAHTLLHFLTTDLSPQSEPIPVCAAGVRGIATARTTDRLYALCEGDVLVDVDRRLRTLVRHVALTPVEAAGNGCDARAVAVSSTGSIVFVLCARTGAIRYLDRITLEPLDSLVVGAGAEAMERSPDGQYAVVLRPAEREIVVADLRRKLITGRYSSALPPQGLAVGSDSRRAFVAAGDGTTRGAVLVLDLATGGVVRQHASTARPASLSVWPGEESPVMRWKR